MSGQDLLTRLKQKFGGKITGSNLQALDPWIEVSPEGLVEVCRFLRDDEFPQLHHRGGLLREGSEEGGEG
jgi:hypothetical protein